MHSVRKQHIMFWLLSLPCFFSMTQVITNDQRLTEFSSSHFQHFPQNPCSSQPGNFVSLLQHGVVSVAFNPPIKFFSDTSKAPITTGTTSTISFHNPPISLFKSWFVFHFSLSFSPTLTSAGKAMSMIVPFSPFLVDYNYV